MARRDRANQAPLAESPAIRLLDALRTGDDDGVLAVCGETTAVSAENMGWSCRGPDEIREILEDARRRFPGLAFESRTRHIGFGLVIDEARVQDVVADGQDGQGEAQGDPEDGAAQHAAETSIEQRGAEQRGAEQRGAEQREAEPRVPAKHLAKPDPDIHPMWDEPVSERRNLMSVWREAPSDDVPPAPLNLPVRVTVRHDDLQVHEITLSFPAALLKRALGLHVDPLEMSLSEVQSAFIAPVGAGFTTYTLARPELMVVPPAAPAAEPWIPEEKPRRRRRRLVAPVLVALVAVVATGGWWAVQGKDGDIAASTALPTPSSTPVSQPSPSPSEQASPSEQSSPSEQPSTSEAPTVTKAKPSDTPSRKPNVTLRSDLAFGFNSSTLSNKAKAAIDHVAGQVQRAGLTGKIYVAGYTDNLGSAAYGLQLSQKRADVVSTYLGSRLVGVPVAIVSVGHGEADPVADNSTRAGRKANRRVTITLPKR